MPSSPLQRAGMVIATVLLSTTAMSFALLSNSSAQGDARGVPQSALVHDLPKLERRAHSARYLDVPQEAKGLAVDPKKGYRLEKLGPDLYLVTDNVYQSMFMVYEKGVVIIDAPPSYCNLIPSAIAEITNKPITHLIYSHSHADHIGGAAALGGHPVIIAQEETKRLLLRDRDPNRPIPTKSFKVAYVLKVGSERLELSYHGNGHEPGNIFIYAPAQRVLMVVDVVFPGWMMWRRFSLAQDIPGYFDQIEAIKAFQFSTFVGGHVTRTGTRRDVEIQSAFVSDLRSAAGQALRSVKPGAGTDVHDSTNPWALFGNYMDQVDNRCIEALNQTWSHRLGGYDVFVRDQCDAMAQSLRVD
jgi:glyoxylase-like metal-dependent hydrolase (beta-lactamase superfamily II)